MTNKVRRVAKRAAVIIFFLVVLGAGYALWTVAPPLKVTRATSTTAPPLPPPRFEKVAKETIPTGSPLVDPGVAWVFHDRLTGDEIICMQVWREGSCYRSGRNWK